MSYRSMHGDTMIVELNGFICHGNIGSKARSIIDLNRYGFKVPTSVALDASEFIDVTKGIKDKINLLLERINYENIEIISKQIRSLFDDLKLKEETKLEIQKHIHKQDSYILRCSIDDDNIDFSYAGIFPIRKNINQDNIEENIIECYKSLYSYNSLYYMLKNDIDYYNLSTAIIIQKEIKTDTLGIITTMNPVSLNTNEMNISITNNDNYEIYLYNYKENKFDKESLYELVDCNSILDTVQLVKDIQTNLGYPVEVELAYTKNSIYVLQAREIKSILYENKDGIWRKKGMSGKTFMYSLVSSNYCSVINDYCNCLKIKQSDDTVSLLFNNCYYNVLDISRIINQLVDYDDIYFFKNLNTEAQIDRKNNLRQKYIRFKNRKYTQNKIIEYKNSFEQFLNEFHDKYKEYCSMMSKVNASDIEKNWSKLIFDDYGVLFKKYIDLKLLVLIEKNRLYKQLNQVISIDEFNNLVLVKEKTSRHKISLELNNLIKKIRDDEEAYRYWLSSSTLKILKNYNENFDKYYHKEFRHFIDNYGYLSYFKYDFSESFYVEDVEDVIRDIKKQIANFELLQDNSDIRNDILDKISNNIKDSKYTKLLQQIQSLQNMIIDLYDLKDYQLKFNFIVKRYTKMLAKLYLKKGILENESDIWHLDINRIYDYIEGDIDNNTLKDYVYDAKRIFNSYRNFNCVNTIGYLHKQIENSNYTGTGCSTDIVTGKARLIKSLKELSTLTHEDILITKTINNNLLFQLPQIRGVVVSDSNLNNSVKTILRELKIPCVILENSSKKINDGMYITIDGSTGKVKIRKK